MMKFPSAVAGQRVPSGSSLAVTNPSVCGSRAGGAGRRRRGVAGASSGAGAVSAQGNQFCVHEGLRIEFPNDGIVGAGCLTAQRRGNISRGEDPEPIHYRIDYAYGKDGGTLYFAVGEAF
jgi:hypothetical protein